MMYTIILQKSSTWESKAVVKLLKLLHRIQNIPDLNLGQEVVYHDYSFKYPPSQPPQVIAMYHL